MIRFLLTALALSSPALSQGYTWTETLDALRQVETGGCPDEGRGARGDGGNAIGPFQIWSIYHTDAAERDRSLTDYRRCLDSMEYSRRVVRAYMNRYCREQLARLEAGKGTLADVERIARVHNGGPRGHRKKATDGYWAKIRRALK